MGTDSVLSNICVFIYFRKRTVVTDGAVQYERHVVLYAVIDDTAVDPLFFDELRDGACSVDGIDGIQMVVVTHRATLLGIDILP